MPPYILPHFQITGEGASGALMVLPPIFLPLQPFAPMTTILPASNFVSDGAGFSYDRSSTARLWRRGPSITRSKKNQPLEPDSGTA
jgi:hypothetical protein